jgi:hypothetical protein
MKRFLVQFNVHTPIQIVFLNNFENCRSPFKNETLHLERGGGCLPVCGTVFGFFHADPIPYKSYWSVSRTTKER